MKKLKLCMLGFGIAGKAFSEILIEKHDDILKDTGYDVVVTTITTGSHGALSNPDGIDLREAIDMTQDEGWFDKRHPYYSDMSSMEAVKTADYDVMLELTPLNIRTGQPAIDHIKNALSRGKHAVSANKGPLAWAYRELRDLAKEKGVHFFFETTVMAGTPVFNMAENCLQYCKISKVEGIFNATTNYILKEMGKGLDYDTILKNGREGGFMEADTSMDTKGYDATAKLTVLSNVLMDANVTPDDIEITGIEDITPEDINEAASRGKLIKLLCKGEFIPGEGGKPHFVGKVAPGEVPVGDVFADENLVAVLSLYTDLMGKLTILQYGIETRQTGFGVFTDVCRIVESLAAREK
jgi:homoserine dehydrogenase